MFQDEFPFSIYCLPKSFLILCETWTIKRQQMAKMNKQVPKERHDLDIYYFADLILKYKIQKLTGVAASTIACLPWAILAKSLVSRSKMLDSDRSQS